MNKRFVETVATRVGTNWRIYNVSLLSFAKKIYGKCPKCQQAAIINAYYDYIHHTKKARIQCLSCAF